MVRLWSGQATTSLAGEAAYKAWETIRRKEGVGLDDNHPALRNEDVDLKLGEITWKEHLAELNALVDAMEEAWEKKNSH